MLLTAPFKHDDEYTTQQHKRGTSFFNRVDLALSR